MHFHKKYQQIKTSDKKLKIEEHLLSLQYVENEVRLGSEALYFTNGTETIDLSILLEQGALNQNRLLKSNDVLHIPRNDALKVFVMGDVVNPTTQQIGRRGMTLAEALNNVGGINEASANASGIFVLRASNSNSKLVDIYQLDVSMGPRLILSTQFKLQPKDIVYVTSAPVARWNKLLAQLTNSLNQIYQIDRIENRY